MDFRVFSQNLPEKMQARCVRKDAEQALMAHSIICSHMGYGDTKRYIIKRCPSCIIKCVQICFQPGTDTLLIAGHTDMGDYCTVQHAAIAQPVAQICTDCADPVRIIADKPTVCELSPKNQRLLGIVQILPVQRQLTGADNTAFHCLRLCLMKRTIIVIHICHIKIAVKSGLVRHHTCPQERAVLSIIMLIIFRQMHSDLIRTINKGIPFIELVAEIGNAVPHAGIIFDIEIIAGICAGLPGDLLGKRVILGHQSIQRHACMQSRFQLVLEQHCRQSP